MDASPLVSAYRYRRYVIDTYGSMARALPRPAVDIETEIRDAIAEAKASADPAAAIVDRTNQLNEETLSALRGVIAELENSLVIDIARLGGDLGAPATGPHIDLRAKLDGVDRGYKAAPLGPGDPNVWYDHFDAQIAHIAMLGALTREVEAARANHVRLPPTGPNRLKWFLFAMVAAAIIAAGVAVLTLRNGEWRETRGLEPAPQAVETPAAAAPVAAETPAETPRIVRTIPIVVPPSPAETTPETCGPIELEVASDGADLTATAEGGGVLARLDANEKVVLREVVAAPAGRAVAVTVPRRDLSGFVAERSLRLPIMRWRCDR